MGTRTLPGRAPTASGVNSEDRKSTRLNSSRLGISYAVFCLKKKIHGISFRSHELPINPIDTKPQLYWKIAFKPPIKLTAEYSPLSPTKMIALFLKKPCEPTH